MTESQAQFSLVGEAEKIGRLRQLGDSRGIVTLWARGSKDRHACRVESFQPELNQLNFHLEDGTFPITGLMFGSFELKGISFFFKASSITKNAGAFRMSTASELYKSERRQNYRLMAYPMHDITVVLHLPASYKGSRVVDIKTKSSQTGLFKSFLHLVEPKDSEAGKTLRLKVQDISVSGMAIHIGEAELEWFEAGSLFNETEIVFGDETLTVPGVRVVYVVSQINASMPSKKKYKVGIRFENLTEKLDLTLGGKINQLLRSHDSNKDFEDFIK